MSEQIPGVCAMKIASVLKDDYTMADILSLTNSFGATKDIDIKYSQAPKMMNKQNVAQQNLSMFSVGQVIQFLTEIVQSDTGITPDEISDYEGVSESWSKALRSLATKHFRESVDNG